MTIVSPECFRARRRSICLDDKTIYPADQPERQLDFVAGAGSKGDGAVLARCRRDLQENVSTYSVGKGKTTR